MKKGINIKKTYNSGAWRPGSLKSKAVFLSALLFCMAFLSGCLCSNENSQLRIVRDETFFNNLSGEPENLHPIRSTDYYSAVIQYYIQDSLLQRNLDTYEWEPLLAKKWSISPDGRTFTFELYEGLKWSDGKPLTVQDIKFTFEAYKNPEYGGMRHLSYYEKMDSAEIINEKTISFHVKETYFGNFDVIANMDIMPEHIYKDPKLRLSKTLIGSGPYILHKYIKGKVLVLQQNPLWAVKNNPENKGKWLFPNIAFRFVKMDSDALLRMEKGHLDYSDLTPEDFMEKTNKPPWGTKIKKVKFRNKGASGYSYIGLNFKNPIFQDQRVRKALAHLLNRRLMKKKFFYDQNELARGPWYFWSDYADPTVQPIEFDPEKAIALLKSAGWKDEDKNGILEKNINGKKTELDWNILFSKQDHEKILTIYQEDLKKAGIRLNLQRLDWTSFLRLINDSKFDAVMLGWSASIEVDPKQIWHSESARKGGSNRIHYSNPRVDALIDKGRTQLNREERIKTFRKVYRLIAEDVPYIFLFTSRTGFYGVNKRIKTPADTLNYQIGMPFWSLKTQLKKAD